jgi:hypothetical protein
MVRSLSQVLENTAYSFTAVLIVYLLGTAFGAWLRGRRIKHLDNFSVITVLTGSAISGTFLLRLTRLTYYMGFQAAHGTLPSMVAVELLVAAIALFPPTVAMGFSFCHFAQHRFCSGTTSSFR